MKIAIGKDRATGLIVSILGIVIILFSLNFPPAVTTVLDDIGPEAFPIIAAAVLIINGIILMVKDKSKGKEKGKPFFNREEWIRFGSLLACYLAYFFLLWLTGFIIATFIMMFSLCTLFSIGKKVAVWKRVLFALLVTAGIYSAFYIGLGLRLPVGILIPFEI